MRARSVLAYVDDSEPTGRAGTLTRMASTTTATPARERHVRGLTLRYEELGEGDPALVLHGWGASREAARPMTRAAATLRHAYGLDLPGFGESDLPPEPWGVGDYAELVLAFMDELGLDRVDLIGHSNGGRIGIWIAAHHPERIAKLVLVDSAGIRPKRGPRYYRKVGMAKAGKYAARLLGPPGRRLQERLRGRAASSDYAAAGPLRPTFVKIVNEDLKPLLPRIQAPTLLVWGARDDATPLADGRAMERLIPNAGLAVFETAGHYSYADEPARFARVLDHFLRA
jgi:pimeloyl-ACP methyl ester carboxylesterase